jgi:hypothetical protein
MTNRYVGRTQKQKWEILIIQTLNKINEEVKWSRFRLMVSFRSIEIIGSQQLKGTSNEFRWYLRDRSDEKHLWSSPFSLVLANWYPSFFCSRFWWLPVIVVNMKSSVKIRDSFDYHSNRSTEPALLAIFHFSQTFSEVFVFSLIVLFVYL